MGEGLKIKRREEGGDNDKKEKRWAIGGSTEP
jgi:hypothetical protein